MDLDEVKRLEAMAREAGLVFECVVTSDDGKRRVLHARETADGIADGWYAPIDGRLEPEEER